MNLLKQVLQRQGCYLFKLNFWNAKRQKCVQDYKADVHPVTLAFLHLWCMCVLHAHECVGAYITHVHAEARGGLLLSSYSSLYFLLWDRLSHWTGNLPLCLVWLTASFWNQLLCQPSLESQACTPTPDFLSVRSIWTRLLMHVEQAFLFTKPFLQPLL